jgi:hypothetical protein
VLVAGGDGGTVEEARDALLELALARFDDFGATGRGKDPHTHTATSETNTGHEGSVSQVGRGGKEGGSVEDRAEFAVLVPRASVAK